MFYVCFRREQSAQTVRNFGERKWLKGEKEVHKRVGTALKGKTEQNSRASQEFHPQFPSPTTIKCRIIICYFLCEVNNSKDTSKSFSSKISMDKLKYGN